MIRMLKLNTHLKHIGRKDMRLITVAMITAVCSSFACASERQSMSANIGLQFQNSADPLVTPSGVADLGELNYSGPDIAIVGNAEFMHQFGGENSDKFGIFFGINTGDINNDPRHIYFGFEFLNLENHSLDVGIQNLGFYESGDFFLGYGANYYFTQNDWLVSGHIHQSIDESDDDQNGIWKMDLFVDKSLPLHSFGNSELVIGGGLSLFPKGYSEYYYGVDNKDVVAGHISADWLYPIAEHWLFTTTLTQGFVGEDLANSDDVDEDNMTQFATGIRYVF